MSLLQPLPKNQIYMSLLLVLFYLFILLSIASDKKVTYVCWASNELIGASVGRANWDRSM